MATEVPMQSFWDNPTPSHNHFPNVEVSQFMRPFPPLIHTNLHPTICMASVLNDSELPLIRTSEMRPPLYWDTSNVPMCAP